MSVPIETLPEMKAGDKPPVVVKKYANRRLYNTESSSYITLENLADMVRQGRDFVVYDAQSGAMQGLVPKYLEHAMTSFAQQQEQMRTAMQKTMGTLFPFGNIEEVGRQNMAMMERAFSMFTPFYRGTEPTNPSNVHASEIEALRSEIERLRLELEA